MTKDFKAIKNPKKGKVKLIKNKTIRYSNIL